MSAPFCRMTFCDADINLGKTLNWSNELASTLRGMFEQAFPNKELYSDETKSDAEKYGEDYSKIVDYYNSMDAQTKKELVRAVLGRKDISYANAYNVVHNKFNAKDINEITNLISRCIFSYNTMITNYNNNGSLGIPNLIEQALQAHPELNDHLIGINKVILDSNKALNDFVYIRILSDAISKNYIDLNEFFSQIYSISNILFDNIENDEDTPDGTREALSKYKQYGPNAFATFLWMAKDELNRRSAINIGKKGKFIELNTEEEQNLLEDSTLEGWMQLVDGHNPFDSARETMRIFLAGVPVMTMVNGKLCPVKSTSTNRMYAYNEPGSLHAMITRVCRDCSKMSDMVKALQNSGNPTLKYIAQALEASPKLRQSFFRDFNRVRQRYLKLTIKKAKNKASQIYRNVMTGRFGNNTFKNHKNNILNGKRRGKAAKFIFKPKSDNDSSVIIDDANFQEFKKFVNDHVQIVNNVLKFTDDFSGVPMETAIEDFVKSISNDYLGLNISKSSIKSLAMEEPALFRSFIMNLRNIANSKYEGSANKAEAYKDFVENTNKAYFQRMFDIIEELEDRNTMTARDNSNGSVYAKDTVTNELGMAINDLRSFAKRIATGQENTEKIMKEFKAYIADTYLKSEEYYDTDEDGNITDIHNDWIRELYNTKASDFDDEGSFINNFIKSGDRYNSLKDGYREILADEMNEKQNLLSFMQEFFSLNSNTEVNKTGISARLYADYNIFTMGDSEVLKAIRGKVYSYDDLKEQFANVAYQELQRMELEYQAKNNIRARGNSKDVQDHEQNIDVSTITISANESNDNFSDDKLDEEDIDTYESILCSGKFVYLNVLNDHIEELHQALKDGDITGFKDKVKEILFDGKDDNLGALKTEFKDNFWNMIDPNQNGQYKSILDVVEIPTARDKDTNKVTESEKQFANFPGIKYSDVYTDDNDVILDDNNAFMMYYLNSKLALIQQFQFFKKNPDCYNVKNAEGALVPSSVMLQKRFKAENTPGTHLNIDAEWNGKRITDNGIERVIYFKEFVKDIAETDPELYAKITDKLGNISDYRKTKSSDGQGFRTLKSYRDVMIMADQWSDDLERVYNEVQEVRKELRTILESDARTEEQDQRGAELIDRINEICGDKFQPIKPHVSSSEAVKVGRTLDDSASLLVPIEHKYAEAILIPELYAFGKTELYYLGKYMEDNNIDLSCSEECVKVGNWGAAELMYDTDENGYYKDAEGNAVETRKESTKQRLAYDQIPAKLSKAIVHEIQYRDYEIQTHVPQHLDTAQLIGTQMRKQMFATILKTGNYNLFSNTLGKAITIFKVAGETYDLTDTEHGSENLIKLYNALVSNKMLNSFLGLADTIADTDKLGDILSSLKTKDAMSTPNAILRYATENGAFKVPLCEFTQSYDNEGYFMSMFKKRVNKQKIKGGSYVQVTDLGYNDDLKTHFDENGNPTYHDCVVTWDLSVNIDGKEVPLKFSDWCHADGTLKTDDDGAALVEKQYPGILDRIAYRIPTERMYSILNLKVKRFVPKCCGGVISVPSYLVTAAGFDFDIDKLYYFKREYNIRSINVENNYDDAEKNLIFGHIYSEMTVGEGANAKTLPPLRPDIAAKLKEYQAEDDDIHGYPITDEKGKVITRHHEHLNKFWDKMLAENPSMQIDESYDKNALFVQSAQDLGLYKEPSYKDTELKTPNMEQDITEMNSTDMNNLFIDIIQSRINDISSFDARFTPGGFTNAKEAANMIKALLYSNDYDGDLAGLLKDAKDGTLNDYEPVYDPTNPITTAIYNARNIIAGKVIGIMANHNTNYAYSQVMNKFTLKTPITLFGRTSDDLLHADNADLWLAELLASSVDAVKAPVLNFLNINTYTANVAALLARTGHTSWEVGLFLNQPIIRRVCEYMSDKGSSNLTAACKAVMKEYNDKGRLQPEMHELDENTLFEELKAGSKQTQMDVLNTFALLTSQAQALSDFIKQTKYTASNSIDNTIGSLIASVYDIRNANTRESTNISNFLNIDLGIENTDTQSPILNTYFDEYNGSRIEAMKDKQAYFKFLMKTPFAFEQVMHDSIEAYIEAASKYFPYETDTYKAIYDIVNNSAILGSIDGEIINVINSNLPVFLLSSQEGGFFNPDTKIYVNEQGEVTYTPRTEEEGFFEMTNSDFYTGIFTESMANFIDDFDDLKAAQKRYDNKCNEYNIQEENGAPQEVLDELDEELNQMEDALDEQGDEFIETYKTWIGNPNLSTEEILTNLFNNTFLNNLEYSAEHETYQDKQSGVRSTRERYTLRLSDNSQFDDNFKGNSSNSWEVLNQLAPALARSLYMANFFTRGFDVGTNVFNNITPVDVLDSLSISDSKAYLSWVQGLTDGNMVSPADFRINNFLKLLYRSNYENYKLVKSFYDLSIGVSAVDNHLQYTDNDGIVTSIDSTGDASVLTIKSKQLKDSTFAIPGSYRESEGGNGTVGVVPAFLADVKEGGNTTKCLYVLKTPANNTVSTEATVYYERIDLPTDSRTMSYSTTNIADLVDDTTLEQSLTRPTETFAERSNITSAERSATVKSLQLKFGKSRTRIKTVQQEANDNLAFGRDCKKKDGAC